MKKINIAIADKDSVYLDRLTNYFVMSAQSFEVFSFTTLDNLIQALTSGTTDIDILMLDEEMRCAAIDRCNISVKILLSNANRDSEDDYHILSKYQKTSDLANAIALLYAKASGHENDFATGNTGTKLIGFYSPIGGSGKTTLSLALAHVLGQRQKKVFYLGMERIDSTCGILSDAAKMSVSDLLVAVHCHEPGIGLQVLTKLYSDPKLGFSYIAPPESSLELNEISSAEQIEILDILAKLGQFDYVVLDFDSELNENKIQLLERCDQIVVPIVADLIGVNKLLRFCRESELRNEVRTLWSKFLFVLNRSVPGAEVYLRQRGVLDRCTPLATVATSQAMANIISALQENSGACSQLNILADRLCQ